MSDSENTEDAPREVAVTPALLAQLEAALCLPGDLPKADRAQRFEAARTMLAGIGPAEGIEAMLACQMVAAHEASMACLARAGTAGAPPERIDRELRQGERLMSLFARQVEALGRLRTREAEAQDRLRARETERRERAERERRGAERRNFLDSIVPTWEKILAAEKEGDDDPRGAQTGDDAAAAPSPDTPAGDTDGGGTNGSGAADIDARTGVGCHAEGRTRPAGPAEPVRGAVP